MELRALLEKVKREWIDLIKSMIAVNLTETPVMSTYDQELKDFKSEVNVPCVNC